MSYLELHVSRSNLFCGLQTPFQKANYVVVGVPFDATSTYRSGARFAPNSIREASANIESYSFRADMSAEDLQLHDLGDLHISAHVDKTLDRLEAVVKDIGGVGKIPIVIGGEHTITLGCLRGIREDSSEIAVVSLDAHLDLRDEFLGSKLSHTTFMRRLNEEAMASKIIHLGTRAVCREEMDYAKSVGIDFITARQIRTEGATTISKKLKEELSSYKEIYLSVDMDVLDPAYAPAVQNPEPEGLETHTLLEMLWPLCDEKVVGFDIVEVTPQFDNGVTSINAAKITFEILCKLKKSHKDT